MNWLLVFLLAIIIAWLLLQWIQRQILFYPVKNYIWLPENREEFTVSGLTGWYFRNDPNNKTVLHNHGNAGNISHLKHIITLCEKQKLNLIVYDYKGYGLSQGTPSPAQVYKDGETIYKYAITTLGIKTNDLILWGESLGGAVATHIASKYECSTLVLLATFSSLDDILLDEYQNISANLICFILRASVNVMPSKEKITTVKCPVVLLHSKQDEVIPYKNAIRMYDSIPHCCKKFIEIKGTHAAPALTGEILKEVLSFCCTDDSRCYCVDELLKDIKDGHARPSFKIQLM